MTTAWDRTSKQTIKERSARFDEKALAADEIFDMHDRRAQRRFFIARPLHAADLTG